MFLRSCAMQIRGAALLLIVSFPTWPLTAANKPQPDAKVTAERAPLVKYAGQWRSPDQVAELVAHDPALPEYRARRQRISDSAREHFKLAQWCRDRGLLEEQRAHLLVAARLDPTDAKTQKLLARSFGPDVDATEQVAARRQRAQAGYRTWRRVLMLLRTRLERGAPELRREAEEELLAIRDPLAVPAIEEVLSLHSEPMALLAVRVLGGMIHHSATLSLARHAVWSGHTNVRQRALESLLGRDMQHYVPTLIEYLRPTRAGQKWVAMGNDVMRVIYWQDFDTNYVHLTAFNPRVPGTTLPAANRSVAVQLAHTKRINAQREQNAVTALRRASGEGFGADQEAWRRWWADVNHVYYQRLSYEPPRRSVIRRTSVTPFSLTPVRVASCFVAGTPVWTRRGQVPIDQVQLGDLVLAMDPTSGELAYKPVVRRTVRPRTTIANVQVGGETLRATPGHPVWVAGKGWVKVEELRPGDSLRGLHADASLSSISQGKTDIAYNLEVAGFSTYFVGRNKVLVHDNTPVLDGFSDN